MDEQNKTLDIIAPDMITTIDPREIDRVVSRMLEESESNYAEIQGLVLECSSALASGEARNRAMDDRSFLKRKIDRITGKDDKLRSAILQDQAVAQYAMQQTIVCVLEECNRNQRLAIAIGEQMYGEVLRLEKLRIEQNEEIMRVRSALVRFYQGYQEQFQEWSSAQQKLRDWAGVRCEYCREPMNLEQIVCPVCGTLQELKMETLPMGTQNELRELARLLKATPEEWDLDITWHSVAKKYAETLVKTRKIAKNAGVLEEGTLLDRDITALINKCRSSEFQIAVVGVLKAGKSTLMNALIGVDLAAVGLNSTTAALTKFRSSNKGHYVKVRFYSEEEWDALNKSASQAGRDNSDSQEGSLYEQLNSIEVRRAVASRIGKPAKVYRYTNLEGLRKGVLKWTAANSLDHIFAAEVEVGIDRAVFDMPEEVVFVDTPGLQDPVKYRSQITKKYIRSANAVLVAVNPDALTEEAFETITTVMDYVGSNKKKVLIVGTKMDRLNKPGDYDTLIEGWAGLLVKAGRYRTEKAAVAQIITVSAYLHLCMKKLLREGAECLTDDEYTNLESGVKKALQVRRYYVEDLLDDCSKQELVEDAFGIKALHKRLERELISKHRELKVNDIARDYMRCRRALSKAMQEELLVRRKRLRIAEKGAGDLAENAATAKMQRDQIEMSQRQIAETLNKLREFTNNQIRELSVYK